MLKKYSFLFLIILFNFLLAADNIITCLPTSEKVIALTFDDGPKHGACEELLTLLDKEQIKATFFVTGESTQYDPDLLYRIAVTGHDIGNHTYSHARLDIQKKNTIKEQLTKNNDIIKQITGQEIKYFRAPGGRYNKDVYQLAKELNLKIVNWSLNIADYRLDSPLFEKGEALFMKSAEMIEGDILTQVKPGDIILMHNGNYETVIALKKVIPALKDQGYQFVKISSYY